MPRKHRSPKYPILGLPTALDLIGLVGKKIQQYAAPRDVIAASLGYPSLHGRAVRTIATLNQYGLLEREGKELRVSELARSYLYPQSEAEKQAAVMRAAGSPGLFKQLGEQYSGGAPNDELVMNFLQRNGFTDQSARQALRAYRETSEFVENECGHLTEESQSAAQEDESKEDQQPIAAASEPLQASKVAPGKFRVAMNEDFLVEVHATGLYWEGVEQLEKWLTANKPFVPRQNQKASEPNEIEAKEAEPC